MRELLLKLKKKLLRRNGVIFTNGTKHEEPKAENISSSGNIIYNRKREQVEFDRLVDENEAQGLDTNLWHLQGD